MSRHATPEGTARYAARFPGAEAAGHFREARGLRFSSIGLGTYLGEADAATDRRYAETAALCLESGVNVLDTAINYRHQRSERSLGAALREKFASGALQRDEVVVCTKGGYLAFDGEAPADPAAWFRKRFVETGIVNPATDVAAGCHCMTPRYLEDQISTSLRNLGLDCIDVYYVHNPETQIPETGPEEFYWRLRKAFEALETEAAKGRIRFYGTATWNGYRVPPSAPEHLSLERVLEAAREAGGESHRFRFLQCPLNLAMPEAATRPTQRLGGKTLPLLEAAAAHGLTVISSASLMQGRLTRGLPAALKAALPNFQTDAQRALQCTRSFPGLTTALAGMSRRGHVEENLFLASVPPLTESEFRRTLG
jgi:aryl-alcohol dehydrogenase-like predicted oxidoreductase